MASSRLKALRCVISAGKYGIALGALLTTDAVAQSSRPSPGVGSDAPTGMSNSAPQAATSTSTFDDWIVRCETKPPAPKICEVAQTIAARNQQQQQGVIAEIVFGRINKTEPLKLIIQLPPGVYLPTGASLFLDDKSPPLAATFTRCQQTCVAEAEVKPEVLQALKGQTKGERGRLQFDDGARRKVTLPVSFKGLPAAFAARDEQAQ